MAERESQHGDDDEMAATHWEFDVDEDSPDVPIAEVIAEMEDIAETERPPMYRTIDDLITELFSDPPPPAAQARVEFSYEGYRILIHQDGLATIMRVR